MTTINETNSSALAVATSSLLPVPENIAQLLEPNASGKIVQVKYDASPVNPIMTHTPITQAWASNLNELRQYFRFSIKNSDNTSTKISVTGFDMVQETGIVFRWFCSKSYKDKKARKIVKRVEMPILVFVGNGEEQYPVTNVPFELRAADKNYVDRDICDVFLELLSKTTKPRINYLYVPPIPSIPPTPSSSSSSSSSTSNSTARLDEEAEKRKADEHAEAEKRKAAEQAEAAAKAEEEARRAKEVEEARLKQEAEEKQKQQEAARVKKEADAKQAAEEEARRRAEEEADELPADAFSNVCFDSTAAQLGYVPVGFSFLAPPASPTAQTSSSSTDSSSSSLDDLKPASADEAALAIAEKSEDGSIAPTNEPSTTQAPAVPEAPASPTATVPPSSSSSSSSTPPSPSSAARDASSSSATQTQATPEPVVPPTAPFNTKQLYQVIAQAVSVVSHQCELKTINKTNPYAPSCFTTFAIENVFPALDKRLKYKNFIEVPIFPIFSTQDLSRFSGTSSIDEIENNLDEIIELRCGNVFVRLHHPLQIVYRMTLKRKTNSTSEFYYVQGRWVHKETDPIVVANLHASENSLTLLFRSDDPELDILKDDDEEEPASDLPNSSNARSNAAVVSSSAQAATVSGARFISPHPKSTHTGKNHEMSFTRAKDLANHHHVSFASSSSASKAGSSSSTERSSSSSAHKHSKTNDSAFIKSLENKKGSAANTSRVAQSRNGGFSNKAKGGRIMAATKQKA